MVLWFFCAEEGDVALFLYIGICRELGWSVSRMNRGMSGLVLGFKMRGLPDLTKQFLVMQALKGWTRCQVVEAFNFYKTWGFV